MTISLCILYFSIIYLVLFLAYAGWGKLYSLLFNLELKESGDCFSSVWIGWGFSLVIFHIIHLAFPITRVISGFFFLSGVCLYLKFNFDIRKFFSTVRIHRVYFFTLLGFSFWVASHALHSPEYYDSGLYHFNSIRWLQEYAIVPGLGNLHGRLAYNMTFFGYIASLNAFPPFSYGHNLGNSFLLMLLFAECLYPIFRQRIQEFHFSQLDLVVKITLIPLIFVFSIDQLLSSPTPDITSAFLRMVLFYNFVIVLDKIRQNHIPSERLKYIIIMSATALTIKLSNAMYALVLILICSFFCYFFRKKIPIKEYLKTFSFVFFFMILWMGRGIILSGCPLYPSSIFCSNFDWTISLKQAKNETAGIMGYRKTTADKNINKTAADTNITNWKWVKPWFKKMWKRKGAFVYPVLLSLFASISSIIFIFYSFRNRRHKDKNIFFLAMVPLWAALIFWFVMSPGLRFANPFLYLLSLAGFLPVIVFLKSFRSISYGLIGALIITINLPIFISIIQYNPIIIWNIFSGAGKIPTTELKIFRTHSGLEIFTPVKGDQCWNSPLPASPYPNPKLHMRNGTVQSGFIIK